MQMGKNAGWIMTLIIMLGMGGGFLYLFGGGMEDPFSIPARLPIFFGLVFGSVILALVLSFVVPTLSRMYVRSSGVTANATLVSVRASTGAIYSGSEYYGNLLAQNMTLVMDVRPRSGSTYRAEDTLTVSNKYFTSLLPGASLQVKVNPANPKHVVALLDTLQSPANMAGANMMGTNLGAIVNAVAARSPEAASLLQQAQQAGQVQVLDLRGMTRGQPADVAAELKQLKELADAGVITPTDFETKKAELLKRL
ncbi:MAG: SHOCT domain-containing protein [Anaerolineae bacterium]